MNNIEQNQKNYPAVTYAYDIALKSYDWTLDRYNAMESRADKLLGWGIGISAGIITFVLQAKNYNTQLFWDFYFICALILFVLAVGISSATKFFGYIKLIAPDRLYENYLHKSEWEFKRNILQNTADYFSGNNKIIIKKGKCLIIALFLFLAEFVFLVLWSIS